MSANLKYHATRAEIERAMARSATCLPARIVHQKLARLHAASAETVSSIPAARR